MIKKTLQLIFVFISVIIIFLAVLLLSINLLLSKHILVRMAADRARIYLNREIVIEKLAFNPFRGLKASGLKLSNPPNFSKGTFFDIKNALISVDVSKFFRKKEIYGEVTVDSLYFDVLEKESILSNLSNKIKACQTRNKDFLLYSYLSPFPVASLTLHLSACKAQYSYSGDTVNLDFDGTAEIFPKKEDQRITLNDFVLKDGRNTLRISGVLNDIYDLEKFSFAFNVQGDKDLMDKLIKFVLTGPMLPDFSFQIGNRPYVDMNISGDLKNIKAVPNTGKITHKN